MAPLGPGRQRQAPAVRETLSIDQNHYESVIPVHPSDVEKTKDLVRKVLDNRYEYQQSDIESLIATFITNKRSKRNKQIDPIKYNKQKAVDQLNKPQIITKKRTLK